MIEWKAVTALAWTDSDVYSWDVRVVQIMPLEYIFGVHKNDEEIDENTERLIKNKS